MPFSYSIDSDRGLVVTRVWGAVTVEDWIAYSKRLAADPAFRPAYDQLADFSQVTAMPISASRAETVIQAAPFGAGSRRAAVATSDLVYGMARVYQSVAHGRWTLEVFRTIEEARVWLGLATDESSEESP